MIQLSQCVDCKHYQGKNSDGVRVCEVFPEGIPQEVFWGEKSRGKQTDGEIECKFEEIG